MINLFDSKYSVIWLETILSIILPGSGSSEIGLKSDAEVAFGTFSRGRIVASFHWSGKTDVAIERFMICRLLDTVRYPSASSHLIAMGGGNSFKHYTYKNYSDHLARVVKQLALPKYTSHSLHRGGASALMEAGFPAHDINLGGLAEPNGAPLYGKPKNQE